MTDPVWEIPFLVVGDVALYEDETSTVRQIDLESLERIAKELGVALYDPELS